MRMIVTPLRWLLDWLARHPLLAFIGSVFIVTVYADDIRIARLRQHDLPVPDDPDLGHPAH